MYACLHYVRVHENVGTHVYAYLRISFVFVYLLMCTGVNARVRMCTCVYAYFRACMHVYVDVGLCSCTYTCVLVLCVRVYMHVYM